MNRRDLARVISQRTGYTIADVEEVLKEEDLVIADAISQGVEVKKGKLMKYEIKTKEAKRAWDGFAKTYYEIPEKKIVKLKPLSAMTEAIDALNEKEQE